MSQGCTWQKQNGVMVPIVNNCPQNTHCPPTPSGDGVLEGETIGLQCDLGP